MWLKPRNIVRNAVCVIVIIPATILYTGAIIVGIMMGLARKYRTYKRRQT